MQLLLIFLFQFIDLLIICRKDSLSWKKEKPFEKTVQKNKLNSSQSGADEKQSQICQAKM